MRLLVGITGASGSIYAKRIIEILRQNTDDEIFVIFTENGKKVWDYELDGLNIDDYGVILFDNSDLFLPPASGSADFDAMVVCPATMSTMSKIANGVADNLLVRAADVMLKENKTLVIVPREMPYNLIHIENMKKIICSGGIVCPASPSFYSKPENVSQLVDTVVQKVLKLLGYDFNFYKWSGN